MSSDPQDEIDSSKPISSPGLQPFLTDAVSRPSRVQGDSNIREDSAITNAESHENENEGMGRVRKYAEDKRPWYRKPSPWWMLTMMPISAMVLGGVNPSLYQVYTDLVCRSIQRSAPSGLAFEVGASRPTNTPDISEYISISAVEEGTYGFEAFRRSDSYVWLQLDEPTDDEPNCTDPVVQAAVSRLMTALLTTQGILSCITAASWASLSDRLGRRPILALTSSAVIVCYTTMLCVYYLADHLLGGYWMLLLAPIIYGLLGGSAGTTAATYAYMSDCMSATERAKTFSLALGLRFTGMAIGPALCSVLVRAAGTPTAALVLVIGTHVAYLIMMLFVVPESLPSEKCAENRRLWGEGREANMSRDPDGNATGAIQRAKEFSVSSAKAVLAFLRPLAIVGPITVTQPSGRTHKDWSLTFIAISAGLASIILASYTSMFLFAALMFGWTGIELGYWYSGIVAARALTLALFLPIIIKVYHYFTNHSFKIPLTSARVDSESSDATPLLSEDHDAPSASQAEQTAETKIQIQKTPAFDLAIAQASLALEVVCYALVPVLISRGKVPYVILTILASCGAGFGPAIQALAVDLYAGRGGTETGRLFGALSVVQTVSSQIVGPTIYGLTYSKLVSFYPQGIFFVSVAAVASAVTFLLFVELPRKKATGGSREAESNA